MALPREMQGPLPGQFRVEMVEEGSGGGHAAAEDGGGEFACGPEGGGLEVEGFVWASGVEGDNEAHDGGDAGAVGARRIWVSLVVLWRYVCMCSL